MGEFKHLVIVKFKEDVVVEDILKGLEMLVSGIDFVKSFEWGYDNEGQEMLRHGFTHAFLMTFHNKEDFTKFLSHPTHVDFSTTFSAAVENIVLLDFPSVLVKATEPPSLPPAPEQAGVPAPEPEPEVAPPGAPETAPA